MTLVIGDRYIVVRGRPHNESFSVCPYTADSMIECDTHPRVTLLYRGRLPTGRGKGGPCRNGDVVARTECLISPGDGTVQYTVLYNNSIIIVIDVTMSGEYNFIRVISCLGPSPIRSIYLRSDRPRCVRGESETSAWESVVIVLGRTRRKSSCRPARRHPRGDFDATNNILLTNTCTIICNVCVFISHCYNVIRLTRCRS